MIFIDFNGGTHGNYLEYVCNAILAQVPVDDLPFNTLGAAHKKPYLSPPVFCADHYFERQGTDTQLVNSKIISIQFTNDDLLPLLMISLLRAGDYNLDNDKLEINTYHKLNNPDYKDQLETTINSFFRDQIAQDYSAVKDPSWPAVTNLDEFKNLPNWIQNECRHQHNLVIKELSPESPDCPRYILREFFKIAFRNPEQSGLVIKQKKMKYDITNSVHIFPYSAFYDSDRFKDEIVKIANWGNFKLGSLQQLMSVHAEFLSRQPYKHVKIKCDTILQNITNHCTNVILPKLELMEESYISAKLELCYNKEIPSNQLNWFQSYDEIWNYFG